MRKLSFALLIVLVLVILAGLTVSALAAPDPTPTPPPQDTLIPTVTPKVTATATVPCMCDGGGIDPVGEVFITATPKASVTPPPTQDPLKGSRRTLKMPYRAEGDTMTFSDVIQAVSVLVSFLIVVIVVIAQHRAHGNLIAALTEVARAQAGNKPALDLVEPLLSKLITPAQVASVGKLGDFLETLTDDQGDQLIEALKTLLGKVTDGQPNSPPDGTLGKVG